MVISPFTRPFFGGGMRIHFTAARGYWDEGRERSQFLEQLQLHQTQIIEYHSKGIGFLRTVERGHDIELHTLCLASE